jgi:hypothetical protein
MILCPDCQQTFPDRDLFVAHREHEHPPTPISVSPAGIDSQERFGWQPESEKE